MAEYQDNYEIVREDWKKKAITWNYEGRYRALGLPGYSSMENCPSFIMEENMRSTGETGSITDAANPNRFPDFLH